MPASEALAAEVAAGLQEDHGVDAECAVTSDATLDGVLTGADMLVAVGGDGTMLRVGRIGANINCPVLGIDLGRLGFLFEVTPDDWRPAVARVLQGDYWLEDRILVHAEHWRAGKLREDHHALNEVVITRGALARPVRLDTRIDDCVLTTYVADGLIVSTPTGSTAYALAAGGPILPPQLRNLVLIPVAPHLSMDRAIVLDKGADIEIIVHTDHEAILSADGQVEIELFDGDTVRVHASPLVAQFVRLQERSYFYANLTAHLVGR
ncbi:MAG: NAD(+)/NADH kinase [Anaerolineales bacterium]